MIKELCNYIEANTVYEVGVDLFAVSLDPDSDIDECIVVAEPSPGLANGILTDLRQVPLVIYSRAPMSRFTARDNAYIIFNLLAGGMQIHLAAIGSGGAIYVCNFVCGTPYHVGLDETGRRQVYSMPLDVTVTNIL